MHALKNILPSEILSIVVLIIFLLLTCAIATGGFLTHDSFDTEPGTRPRLKKRIIGITLLLSGIFAMCFFIYSLVPQCPNCDKKVGGSYCTHCGTQIPSAPTCDKCGEHIAKNNNFCGNCGAEIYKE